MSRSARLLRLLQAMRGRRQPVTAARLAEALEVSERTIYRDIAELMSQGAPIDGEAGVGYILRPGLFLRRSCCRRARSRRSDAMLNDIQREFIGTAAIRGFGEKEIFGVKVTMD